MLCHLTKFLYLQVLLPWRHHSLSSYLPDAADCAQLRENYSILLARVIVEELPYFKVFRDRVVNHIKHEHSLQMKEKSVVVS